ncbi:MAG: DUF167 domain-containing protein [Actinobacteria bacterium]|nr:DUF167 domain-containing protein [Actinomycetota bacterium]
MSTTERSPLPTPNSDSSIHVSIHLSPGAKQGAVGGRHGDDEAPLLRVKVSARAVDGAANDAATEALAKAFGLGKQNVKLRAGKRSRTKHFEIIGGSAERLRELLGSSEERSS